VHFFFFCAVDSSQQHHTGAEVLHALQLEEQQV
jgi:hypothetical protein